MLQLVTLMSLASLSLPAASQIKIANAAGDWSVDRPLPIVIQAGDADANSIKALGSFTEASTQSPLTGTLHVCATPEGTCAPVSVPKSTARQAYLRYQCNAAAGSYKGGLILTADGVPASDKQALNVYVASGRTIGVLVVILGAVLAWLVRVYIGNRLTRDQALLPVAADLERLRSVTAVLKHAMAAGAHVPNLSHAVADWKQQLNPMMLEATHGLPAAFPSPFAAFARGGGDFQAFLTKADAQIAILQIFASDGITRIFDEAEAGTFPRNRVGATVTTIDQVYSPDLTAAAATTSIANAIAKGRPTAPIGATFKTETRAPGWLNVNRLTVEIRTLNSTAWIVLLVAAVLATIVAVVLKPGFGKVSDFIVCFTTAFGVPVVGGAMLPSRTATAAITSTTQSVSGSPGSVQ